ncbi:TIGR02677 family protein [Natronosporangium hydrolyticum]|uniref:TIGR02677 family protein n=1 Tax=Natronosporangium hydrolyticum TaxID=2811111 RepID=A0A895YKP6_9ACTN|nr:TIGR02677 family protein [Natronosporangium hydrolyticum]QSB16592.1 TIGR02677 family protein [Natronosporangium hydrolyticum]
MVATGDTPAPTFGLDDFGLDERMRLFSYLTADNRFGYLWVLRAFDAARSNYHVLLHTSEVAAALAALRDRAPDCPDPAELELSRLLDMLVEWGVLDRGQDSTRATTLAEYRNRHSVYQFTEAGYRAHRAVENVLSATMDDSTLSRLVFADLLADLAALATANAAGDSEEVYRKLNRLDRALADMVERAARFYHMLGDLSRTNDLRPETFLAHKDALLAHLRDFHDELQRYTPRLRTAVHEVEATGLDRLVAAAAEADERIFRTPADRLADWQRRWDGLRSWLAPPGADEISEADRLADATMAAIGDVLALLRRITEARRGGVSRESQLRHLAAWFCLVETEPAAHALFDATFGLGAPRHVSVAFPDPEAIPTRHSWWDAPAVELSRTLVTAGQLPGQGKGRPARLDRADAPRAVLRQRQLAEEQRLGRAAAELAELSLGAQPLDDAQTGVLLRMLDLVLGARAPGAGRAPLVAAAHGVRLTLTPTPGRFTTVPTSAGALHLDGYQVTVSRADHTISRGSGNTVTARSGATATQAAGQPSPAAESVRSGR